ncbi:Acyl-CoA N-acyltransferase [Artemisia annua]|uniref:Acyl-CoA N-acyltransferase n=1 Tax=Artemisia annua TaxID=35608 RepID=A0A2U1PC21_ARTAN|nr:Acyl-CoA N-acyltransferase [Artemisia annua]
MKLRTRTVKRKTTNPKMELKIRPKQNARAPKIPGCLVEPVFKRTRCPVLRQNAENNVATETSPVGALISEMMSCSLCEENFHRSCVKKVKGLNINSSSLYFCGTKCREIITWASSILHRIRKTQLQDGFSFSLLKSYDLRKRLNKNDPIKAECKPKLAKAFGILNKCFHGFVDDINHTNIIHNLVYNWGSHIRSLNYSGFFTAILEKDDEVISTATIRIHGNKLVEMPFIGTRKGRCTIFSCGLLTTRAYKVLGSFGVEELIIPSAEGTLRMWTKFGFKPRKESTKQKMKFMSVVVFAGTNIFQKRIPKKKEVEALPDFTDNDYGQRSNFNVGTPFVKL